MLLVSPYFSILYRLKCTGYAPSNSPPSSTRRNLGTRLGRNIKPTYKYVATWYAKIRNALHLLGFASWCSCNLQYSSDFLRGKYFLIFVKNTHCLGRPYCVYVILYCLQQVSQFLLWESVAGHFVG